MRIRFSSKSNATEHAPTILEESYMAEAVNTAEMNTMKTRVPFCFQRYLLII